MDKRRYARLVARLDITIKKINEDGSGDVITVVGKDISAGGVGFTSEREIKVGDVLKLAIRMPTDYIVNAVAGVKWVIERENLYSQNLKDYQAGAEFSQISDSDRKMIDDFVAQAKYNGEQG